MPNHTAWQKTVFTQPTSTRRAASVIAGAALAIVCALGAQQARAQSLYVQYGAAERNAKAWTLGAQLPWRNWQYALQRRVPAAQQTHLGAGRRPGVALARRT